MKSAQDFCEGFTTELPVDLQGWHSNDPLFAKLIDETKPKRIIEVGSWKGASALHMAGLTKALETCIYCVDTWLGGVDHMLSKDPLAQIPQKHGYSELYWQFLRNVQESGHAHRIFPIPNTSANGLRYLYHKEIKAELIYLDGSHERMDVFADLILAEKVLAEGGVVFGDDISWEGVQDGLLDYLGRRPSKKAFQEGQFWILK